MSYREPGNRRTRIDARPINDPAAQAGMRNIHYGMDGKVIGGTTAEGQAVSTARRGQWTQPPDPSAPATGQKLLSRQNLYKQMQAAGPSGLTPDMRAKAAAAGVTDEQFNSAADRLAMNAAYTPATPAAAQTPAPPVSPSWQTPPALSATQVGMKPFQPGQDAAGLTPQIASNTPGPVPTPAAGQPRINRLTGKPMGWLPGDAEPASPPLSKAQQSAAEMYGITQPSTVPGVKAQMVQPMAPVTPAAPLPRGPASQPEKTGSALDDPNNALSKAAYTSKKPKNWQTPPV